MSKKDLIGSRVTEQGYSPGSSWYGVEEQFLIMLEVTFSNVAQTLRVWYAGQVQLVVGQVPWTWERLVSVLFPDSPVAIDSLKDNGRRPAKSPVSVMVSGCLSAMGTRRGRLVERAR